MLSFAGENKNTGWFTLVAAIRDGGVALDVMLAENGFWSLDWKLDQIVLDWVALNWTNWTGLGWARLGWNYELDPKT